jgi:hypothetical protein
VTGEKEEIWTAGAVTAEMTEGVAPDREVAVVKAEEVEDQVVVAAEVAAADREVVVVKAEEVEAQVVVAEVAVAEELVAVVEEETKK